MDGVGRKRWGAEGMRYLKAADGLLVYETRVGGESVAGRRDARQGCDGNAPLHEGMGARSRVAKVDALL